MANCWLQRTPLETAFLLMLAVATPFFITISSVYIYLLVNKCPDCSISCLTYCEKTITNRADVIPKVAQLKPNISLSRLHEKYKICPEHLLRDILEPVDHNFVASVLEDVFSDDYIEQRYLCSAAVITFKWVLTGSRCVQTKNHSHQNVAGLFVRAGSNYWTVGGSIHEVQQILFAETNNLVSTIAAIQLKTEFPKFPTIRPIMLSSRSHYTNFGIAEIFNWKTNDSAPLHHRKKYSKLISDPALIFKDARCKHEANADHIFCALNVKPTKEKCTYFSGFPLIRARVLLGIDVGSYCDRKLNLTVYLIYDLTKSLEWVVKTTGAYVEHF